MRNIRRKIRPEEQHKFHSPWNIASDFLVDMSFSAYPFLVSRLCKLMDERIVGSLDFADKKSVWTKEGFLEAVRMLLAEKNTLFESLTGKLSDYPELKKLLYLLLFQGQSIVYNPDDATVDMALMFGFVKTEHGMVTVANRIFETRLYNMFLTLPEEQESGIYIKY